MRYSQQLMYRNELANAYLSPSLFPLEAILQFQGDIGCQVNATCKLIVLIRFRSQNITDA